MNYMLMLGMTTDHIYV